jgi:hypothetical protein
MAQYFTDDWSSLTGWTNQYKSASWTAAADLDNPSTVITTDWCALTQDSVTSDGDNDDVDLLAVVNIASLGSRRYPLIGRGSGADESATHYAVALLTSNIRIYYCSGSDAPVYITGAEGSISISVGNDYWLRLRINGTAVKAKIWSGAAGDEPGGAGSDSNWNVSTTDSTISGTGWAGPAVYGVNTVGFQTWKQLGVGTNGDTAPSSAPAAAASLAMRRAFPRPILNF